MVSQKSCSIMAIILALAALVCPLCSALVLLGYATRGEPVPVEAVLAPPAEGEYVDVAWLDQGLVVQYEPSDVTGHWHNEIWLMRPDGSDAQRLPLPKAENCHVQAYEGLARLPDGRLGYVQDCIPPNQHMDILHMVAYDLRTGEASPLLSYSLPSTLVGTGGYSWNPEMTRGITSDGNGRGLAEQLYWFAPDHWERLDVGLPQAYGAAWSPDGQSVAYLGAPEQGLYGVARTESLYNLYIMRPDKPPGEALVTDLQHVSGVTWSSDSRWLAFPAIIGTWRRQRGMWLVEVATGKQQLVMAGDLALAVWSPDGQHLALLQLANPFTNQRSAIRIVDASRLTW